MAVHFDRNRMQALAEVYERWWRGELDRPLVRGVVEHVYPKPYAAPAPILNQSNCHDFSWTPEQIIDALDSDLST